MHPALQAVCDQYVLDTANILAALARAEPRAVGPVVAHIASTMEAQAEAIEALIGGSTLPPVAGPGLETVSPGSVTSDVAELSLALARARHRVIAAVTRIPPSRLSGDAAAGLLVRLSEWSRHGAFHAFDLADASETLRADPFFLNWALFTNVRHDPGLTARRQRLIDAIRKDAGADTGSRRK